MTKFLKSLDISMFVLNRHLQEVLKAFPDVVINSPETAVPEVLNFSQIAI
jgi:hypothetical protein